ncbi:glycine dehydrogenase (decarboxylating) subunit 2 [Candidatus Bilamarchaeum dharawalense]|uniref:Probable glycine dehydrogenase (decarboxylating) subunit 2 n=1 Tax=Candidatus Bilamarchaeum dharawalense TaxID=2885759 RepID=A0A5E4LRU1_9ARCH|nr:glycine dehydrogenase (decarboxylating) subunit 2 [Candidatus Bilamarchaeum dharawalense]
MKTIFENGGEGRAAVQFSDDQYPTEAPKIEDRFRRKNLKIPEVSEIEVVRHYTTLSKRNYGVDLGFYPLGSCTMKYNPKVNEDMAKLEGFTNIHPMQPEELSQGALQMLFELQEMMKEITGFDAFSLQPAAGAHGELVGVMMIKAYFQKHDKKRKKILIPDSAHGTNPASVTLCGLETQEVKSDGNGNVDLNDLRQKMNDETAGLMLTNPNTLGLFDQNIIEICKIVHEKGGLVYCDGANLNAMVGVTKPRDAGFDIMHVNFHKTFSTPHGCGGPGAGGVGVVGKLASFLPKPMVNQTNGMYHLDYNIPDSIGKVKSYYGNFGVLVKAYTYIRALGPDGLKRVGQNAVLNANYMRVKLMKHFDLPYKRICQHEFVISDRNMPNGVTTMDLAKRLLDYGYHSPTIYFPLIVHGAIMIEPTETETRETMDSFIETMLKILQEAQTTPELVKGAPHTLPVKRLDGVKAAREPVLTAR